MCRISSTQHDSSIPLLKNRVGAGKKIILTVYNRASDYWRIKPATVEESCKRILKHKMGVWYNVTIVSALDFQITYYMQYQLHKVLPSVPTKAKGDLPRNCSPDHFSSRFLTFWKRLSKKCSFGYDLLFWERYFAPV